MKKRLAKIRGQINLKLLITGLVAVAFVAMVAPIIFSMAGMVDTQKCLDHLQGEGYVVYSDPGGTMHAQDILPEANCTYDLGSDTFRWDDLYLCNSTIYLGDTNITANGSTVWMPKIVLTGNIPIKLEDSARSWIEFRPDLDPTKLAVNAKPTIVERGAIMGYSLPLEAADEELFYSICVPNRWDGESDIHVHIHGWIDTAQDETRDAVNLSLDWESFTIGDVVPDTANTVTSEIVTGIVAQYTSYQFCFLIDYDIDVGDPIIADDELNFRLYRVAVSTDSEIQGEIVVCHAGVVFKCDKFGYPDSE